MTGQKKSVYKRPFKSAGRLALALAVFLSMYSCNSSSEDLIGNWIRIGDFGGVRRCEAVSAVVGNKAYVGFGWSQSDGTSKGRRLKDLWSFDGSVWTNVVKEADAPMAARSQAVAFVIGSKIYIGSGYDGNTKRDDFWSYDTETGQWEEIDPLPGGARTDAVAFTLTVNGTEYGYVGTGFGLDKATDLDDKILNDFWRYDEQTGWSEESISTYGVKVREAVSFVINNKAYVVTGWGNDYTNFFACLDPATNNWTELRKVSDVSDESYDDDYATITRSNAVSFVVGGKGYISTAGRGTTSKSTWEYDPTNDTWIEKTGLEGTARNSAVAFVLNGVPYVTTGKSASTDFDDVWIFQPNAEYDDSPDK